jgi:fatty acid-binding protein DegV
VGLTNHGSTGDGWYATGKDCHRQHSRHLKPLIAIQSGHVEIVAKARTRSRALNRLESMVRVWVPLAEVMVLHTGAAKLAEDLAGLLWDLIPDRQIAVEPAGSGLATPLGLGAVGVCALAAGDE